MVFPHRPLFSSSTDTPVVCAWGDNLAASLPRHGGVIPTLSPLELLPILLNFARGVVAGGAHHAAAGVGAGAAQIQPANGCAILCPTGRGAQEEELIHAHLAVKDIASRHSVCLFE